MIERYAAPSYMVPGRLFQLRSFTQTHCRLQLQSNPSSNLEYLTRIEILFPGVRFVCLPPNFRGLHLRRADDEERAAAFAVAQLENIDDEVYLVHPTERWFVISGSPSWVEAERAYNDPSLFSPEGLELQGDVVFGDLTG